MITFFEIIIGFFGSLTAALAAGSAVLSFLNRKKIERVHVAINGRLDMLLQATRSLAWLEGAAEARAVDNNGEQEKAMPKTLPKPIKKRKSKPVVQGETKVMPQPAKAARGRRKQAP